MRSVSSAPSGERLIEEQHLRIRGEAQSQLELAPLAVGSDSACDRARAPVLHVLPRSARLQGTRRIANVDPQRTAPGTATVPRGAVLQHGERHEDRASLVAASQARSRAARCVQRVTSRRPARPAPTRPPISPERTFTSVVLPAPLVPIQGMHFARMRSIDTPSTAMTPPQRAKAHGRQEDSGPRPARPRAAAPRRR